jgi:hypothetical protein
VYEHHVEIVNIPTVGAVLFRSQVHGREGELKPSESSLNSRVSHAVVTELRTNVGLDHITAHFAN